MIMSFLLCRGQPNEKYQINPDALEKYGLPIAQDLFEAGVDCSFSKFLRAIYQDYDLDEATKQVDTMVAEANDDLLMRKYVLDMKHQANVLIMQMKAKIYRVIPMAEIKKAAPQNTDQMIDELQRQLEMDGFSVETDAQSVKCGTKPRANAEELVKERTFDLFKKTE